MSDDALAGTLKRTELQHQPSSIPGREIVQVLTEIPVGVESGWHVHPGEEIGYILAGTVEMKVHGGPSLMLHAGDPFLIAGHAAQRARPGSWHRDDAVDVHRGGGQAARELRRRVRRYGVGVADVPAAGAGASFEALVRGGGSIVGS